ncbi:TIGR03862 family flavoprotein [Pararhodobacter marinus]|uniref:TIGR03862 family flavoprotein n=1 Tax=Pararhodobacter marinus TaxID=2184063 RepID=UPI0035191AA9
MAPDALVVGAGPAGLMAADRLLAAGCSVLLAEAKPSPARKLLMAGKSGLNVTKDETLGAFISNYDEASDWLRPILAAFGPAHVQDWMRAQGQEVFTGSSGRVFPQSMKASPLLRHWLADLRARGLDLRTRWRWRGGGHFDTPDGPMTVTPKATVLAMGGASWARLGSDGAWAGILREVGVEPAPFRPANMGFRVDWSEPMARYFGEPLKGVALIAGDRSLRAEAVISARGLEGGGIYALSRTLRDGAGLFVDLFPDLSAEALTDRIARRPARESAANRLRKLGLAGGRLALVQEFLRPLPADPRDAAQALKRLPIPLSGPRPMDEAISTAGGIRRADLTDELMLCALPGTFAAGEMLDWEAPTGGYLLTACLATGRWAGDGAARFIASRSR